MIIIIIVSKGVRGSGVVGRSRGGKPSPFDKSMGGKCSPLNFKSQSFTMEYYNRLISFRGYSNS